MRRTGKTWFCFQAIQDLEEAGIARDRILYLNFEDERLLPLSAARILRLIPEVFHRLFPDSHGQEMHFFFDEIQHSSRMGILCAPLAGFQGTQLNHPDRSLPNCSAARSPPGFAAARSKRRYSLTVSRNSPFCGASKSRPARSSVAGLRAHLGAAFDTYLRQGDLKEVQGDLSDSLRREILQDYLDVVVLRDVVERHGVSNVPALRALLRHLLQCPGGRFSVHRFMNNLKSPGHRLRKEPDSRVPGASRRGLSGLCRGDAPPIGSPTGGSTRRKVYTIDTGLSHAVSLARAHDRGAALESCVFMALRRRGVEPDYGITPGGNEVDFVFEDDTGKTLMQSAWSLSDPGTRARETRALEEALDAHMGNRAVVVTAYEEDRLKIGRHEVRVVPAWRWLLEQEAESDHAAINLFLAPFPSPLRFKQ